jgi:hypothetical protein
MTDDGVLAELLERCRRDHSAWINGDGSGYGLPDDGTILGGIGGWARGGADTAERQAAVARQWASGRGTVELLNGGVHGDLAWLALVERATVVLAGETEERRWDLRVTEVFRLGEQGWERVHRHADPVVDRRPLAEVAALF